MAEPTSVSLAPQGELHLAPKVAIGIVDVAAVGARVLLALQPPAGWQVREVALEVKGLGDGSADGGVLRPVLSASSGPEGDPGPAAPALLVRNIYSPGAAEDSPQVSLLVVNADVPEGAQAELAAAMVELACSGGPGGGAQGEGQQQAVLLASAMLLTQLPSPAGLYQHLIHGAPPAVPLLPPLPLADAASAAAPSAAAQPLRVRDGLLAALLHVMAASGTPACCLLAPGHKPPSSTPLDLPGSAAACDALGAALSPALGLSYDPAACRAVRATHKWFVPEKTAGSDIMYL
ncbi:hypothetical protein HYH03_010023 [Edaphochlamys debaryana]|uniref:Proteasome assembly chaperone 1 n=1 Tax=Edaphochlamys debaryana TaxID=47281 RepID=A0A836BXW5_9CHLO|nr:hypothetical protein HYH03_010023 [Edaphochlamys debaryana]|eukprot:KAG2491653.1 hypothetical protein HYH03_010023 [Edaphochlamys debaryana]